MISSNRTRLLHVLVAVLLPAASLSADQSSRIQASAYLDELWRTTGTQGFSAAVLVKGRLVFSEGRGFADLENMVPATGSTVYSIGSVSKAVTAVAVLQLVERGAVDLDEAIQAYVPSFPEKRSPITVWHLLTHTSGIRHYLPTDFPGDPEHNHNQRSYTSFEEAIEVFKDDPLLFEPGEYYSYTSYGINLLQGVVEAASGIGFEEYLMEHVWGPAAMFSTAFDEPGRLVPYRAKGYLVGDAGVSSHPQENVSYKYASGGMIGSAEDLVRFGWALNHGHLLQPETLAFIWSPHVDPVLKFNSDGPPVLEDRWKLGLTWRIRDDDKGRTLVYAPGTVNGFNAVLVDYQEEDTVVAVVGNGHPVSPALREALAVAEFFLGSSEPGPGGRQLETAARVRSKPRGKGNPTWCGMG